MGPDLAVNRTPWLPCGGHQLWGWVVKGSCITIFVSLPHECSQVALVVKNLPVNAGDLRDQFDPWVRKESMLTHSSILAWRIPWTEEPHGLESTRLQRVRHD